MGGHSGIFPISRRQTAKMNQLSVDLACRQVLMSAYLYYQRDQQVLTDPQYEDLVEYVVDNWWEIPDRYMPLLDPDNIGPSSIKSTSFHCKYTRLVEGGAIAWLRNERNIPLEPLGYGYYEFNKPQKSLLDDLLD